MLSGVQKRQGLRLTYMKQWCCVLIFLSTISCRTIEGNYFESFGTGWGGAHYTFHTNGTFAYESHYDVGGGYGQGIYSYRWGRMRMAYGTTPKRIELGGEFNASSVSTSDTSYHEIRLFVNDENNYPMPGALIRIFSSSNVVITGCYTDMEGYARLMNISTREDSVIVHIHCMGYMQLRQKIALSGLTTIRAQLAVAVDNGMCAIDSGSVEEFRVRKFRKDSFLLKRSERRQEWSEDGKRVSRRYKVVKKLVRDTI